MSDSGFSVRLAELEALLGLSISFDTSPPSPAPTETATNTPVHSEPAGTDTVQLEKHLNEEKRAARQAKEREMAERFDQVYDCSSFVPGEPVDENTAFSPWSLVSAYPSNFVGKTNRPHAKRYFDEILHERIWDFFYLHEVPGTTPHLLVPTAQFAYFLDQINMSIDTKFVIPTGMNGKQYFMKFRGGVPRPRYFKRSSNEHALSDPEWPTAKLEDFETLESVADQFKDAWTANIKVIKKGIPYSSKTNPEKAARKQRARKQMLLETQQFLGLKPSATSRHAVLVCVDVEAIETSPNCITEVGFAILDTAQIKDTPRSKDGSKWFQHIKSYHLRIREYAGHRNNRYVKGCPDRFDFGTSTFPTTAEISEEIRSIFRVYTEQQRPIVLVGHDVAQDIKYLSKLGVDTCEIKGYVGEIDTKDIYQAWKDEDNGRGLGYVLASLKVQCKHLHNAGNDAYYTLCAAILVAQKAL